MSGTVQWTPLGPDCIIDGQMHEGGDAAPVSGRVTCLLLDGATLYAGTAGGGVWRTDDDGRHWTPLDDQLPSLAIGALGLDAGGPQRKLLIATGEGNSGGRMQHGQGLFVYDIASRAVQRVTAIPNGASRFRLLRGTALFHEPAVAPDPAAWWYATTDGLFRSTDGGTTWTAATITGVTTTPVAAMGFHRTDAVSSIARVSDDVGPRLLIGAWGVRFKYFAVAGGPVQELVQPGALYQRSAGAVFDPLPTSATDEQKLPPLQAGRIGLATAPSDDRTCYALFANLNDDGFAGLFVTGDGGHTWQRRSLPADGGRRLRQSSYNLVLAVHPTDPDTLIFGDAGLWRSTDGGASWTHLAQPRGSSAGTHSDQHAVVYDPAHPGRVWLGNDGGVWLSEDGGDTWAHRNRGLNTLQYYALAHHPQAESVLLAGAQDNGTQRFAGHAGWNLVNFGDGFYCAIDAHDPRYWYSSYVYKSDGKLKGFQRSDSAGQRGSWSVCCDGIDPDEYVSDDAAPFYVPFLLDPATAGVGYLGTTRLWRTTNRGDSWLPVLDASGQPLSFAPLPNPPPRAGDTPPKPSGYDGISALCIDPNDRHQLYVGTRYGHVFSVRFDRFDDSGHARATLIRSAPSLRPGAPALPGGLPGEPPPALETWVTDLAVAPQAATVPLAQRPVYIAFGSDYLSGDLPQHMLQGRVWKCDFSAASPAWTPLSTPALDVAFPAGGPSLPAGQNFANALAFDPVPVDAGHPPRLYVGCHLGVYEFVDSGAGTWTRIADGLPNVPVVDLQFHPARRLLRAATLGRGVWERVMEPVPAPSDADVFIRDNIVDLGRYDTPADALDPLDPPDRVAWFDGVDIKVDTQGLFGGFDTPAGSEDYAGGPIDYIGFQQLDQDRFQRGKPSKVYVQVANRGPQAATGVVVRAFWARKVGDGFPDLPADFWAGFPAPVLPALGAWQAVGDARTIASLRPGAPAVVQWDFTAPDEDTELGLLAIVSAANDPVSENRTAVEAIARSNKHVVLRRVPVIVTTGTVLALVLVAVGAVALVAVSAAAR